MSRLALGGDITDEAGMASAILAAEVGYPGSSIAFAQLLSGMQRSGLIEREVRGKRTYRITAAAGASARVASAAQARPARQSPEPERASWRETGQMPAAEDGGSDPAAAAGAARAPGAAGAPRAAGAPGAAGAPRAAGVPGAAGVPRAAEAAVSPGDFDYDELARRLLVQVVRRLASAPGAEPAAPAGPGDIALEQTVAGLERELASVRTMHGSLTEENARLREQLTAARRSLALAQDRAVTGRPVSDQLDAAGVSLLARLLAPSADGGSRQDAETG